MFYKKLFLTLSIAAVTSSMVANSEGNYDSGKARIANIMSNEETGIPAYNKKNMHYAQTLNLAEDLNIDKIAEFFCCKTVMGHQFLIETLKCPVTSEDKNTVLAKRQHAIKVLVENPNLKKEIDQLLLTAKNEEQDVIKLMSEFFIGKTCPEIKVINDLKKQSPYFAYPVHSFLFKNPTGKTIKTAVDIVSTAGSFAGLAFLTYYDQFLHQIYPNYVFKIYFAILAGFGSYATYKDYSSALEKRSKIHSLNELIAIAEKFELLCSKYTINNQFSIGNIKNAEGVQLVEKLKHSRYEGKKRYLFFTPAVHTFLYSLYENDKNLAEIFACVAELDTYNAIATKIIESQNTNNKFCFVSFLEQEKPMITAKGFWNVLVGNAVTNDLSESRHVILTGPNAGGKTTTIKALLQNIIFGQCYGVAAATEFNATMFDIIHAYLNISDDLIKGNSLFVSEVKRAQGVLQTIKSLEGSKKKFFFALDELFTGTGAEDGEKCAYEFVKRISAFDNVQFIYATHFNKLKELGKDNDLCVNYKVDAPTKNADGKLVYPFTLNKGANESYVALDIAKEANLFA